jgi:phage terminase large subunit-like protein
MGLRGPGAKPVAKRQQDKAARSTKRPYWKRKGLSRAERVIHFVQSLPITSGVHAGRRMKLRPWQRDIVEALYATDDTGKRFVRTGLITLPRKNGKTQISAALALAHLAGPEVESRGQIYSAAADKEQAAILFREMKAIIEAVPELEDRIIVRDFLKELEDSESGTIYRALSSDAKTKHGQSASVVIYDELAQAPNRDLYDVLTTSTAARAEPLTIVISTQTADSHHVMSELVDYGRQVNDGTVEDRTFHATIYSAPLDADPWDEKTWFACNPALGDFRSLDEMRTSATQAQRIPQRESVFKLLYLNMPVEVDDRFISATDWDACAGDVDPESLIGRPCYGGLDLASVRDLNALVLYFPEDNGAVLAWFWAPGGALDEREREDKVPYATWARQGLLQTTPGRAVDKRAIAYQLGDIGAKYDVTSIAYDRWGMAELDRLLADEGVDLPMEPYGQGFRDMAGAVDALERAILRGELLHPSHPILTWNLSNVLIDTDPAGLRKCAKNRSRDRVDGAVALMMALGLAARVPAPVEYDFTAPLVVGVS